MGRDRAGHLHRPTNYQMQQVQTNNSPTCSGTSVVPVPCIGRKRASPRGQVKSGTAGAAGTISRLIFFFFFCPNSIACSPGDLP
ncbi:unnamed protein product [Ixodes pacificus]